MTDAMIGPSDVEAAWRLIRPYVRRTPAIELAAGSLGFAGPLALKLESLQVSGSFKGRGAFHKLLSSTVPPAGIIAASGGNHGAAAAYAARTLGHRAEIFVPTIASPAKVARLKAYGAIVHQVGAVYAEARAASETRAIASSVSCPSLSIFAPRDRVIDRSDGPTKSPSRPGVAAISSTFSSASTVSIMAKTMVMRLASLRYSAGVRPEACSAV